MDEEERIRMAESGVDSEDYKLFLEVNMMPPWALQSYELQYLPMSGIIYRVSQYGSIIAENIAHWDLIVDV